MENYQASIYRDMEQRTGGEIYLGVVGPVRTGKSTFIKKFMELFVLPQIADVSERERARDELPQSASGKMIMTTEPKFIPKEAAVLSLEKGSNVSVRMVDCVGYLANGAEGYLEDGKERMVQTPWSNQAIPFTRAAEMGTEKVIKEHATVGILVTSDGSFGELGRNAFLDAEKRTVEELKLLGKPFVVLLNSSHPDWEETRTLAEDLEKTYEVSVIPVNCEKLQKEDVLRILNQVLMEFPVVKLEMQVPSWMDVFCEEHEYKKELVQIVKKLLGTLGQMKDVKTENLMTDSEFVREIRLVSSDLSTGTVRVEAVIPQALYYDAVSRYVGQPIADEQTLLVMLYDLLKQKNEYESLKQAMDRVKEDGYGVVPPERKHIVLSEPELIKHGSQYGVQMKATSESIHMIRAGIETVIAPIIGNQGQANDLALFMKQQMDKGEEEIWQTSIFGKTVEQIVMDGMSMKISQLTRECQQKLRETLMKLMSETNGRVILIII